MALLAAAEKDEAVIGLTADLAITAGLERMRLSMPDRIINVGIAEQNLVGMSAGFAADGWKPYAVTFANFAAMRSCEFVRHHLGYLQHPVTVVGIGAGFAMGQFGTTHYSLEDVSVLRAIPNLTILSPADCDEVWETVEALAAAPRPAYLRLSGAPSMRLVDQSDAPFRIGAARELAIGADLTLVATGSMVSVAVAVASRLRTDRELDVGVVNVHTIKPLDVDTLDNLSSTTARLVTIEEHSVVGGLGAAVAETISRHPTAPPLLRLGVVDTFPKVGSYEWVLEQCGLTDEGAYRSIVSWLDG